MSLFATIRRKRHSALQLSVVAFALLAVIISPCSQAFLLDGQHPGMTGKSEIHNHSPGHSPAHSHGSAENPIFSDDCCCDHPDVVTPEVSKPHQSIPFPGLPADPLADIPANLAGLLNFNQNVPVRNNSPPVFLCTRRIRL